MMSIALGTDAFSLGIGIGLQKLSKEQILKISITVGIFHVLMPLIGIIVGNFLLSIIGDIARILGGVLLIILGINMLIGAISSNKKPIFNKITGLGLIFLAFSVSIDALSVGFSLGLFSADLWLVVLLFGLMGAVMTLLGLTIGNRIGSFAGDYGEAFGGLILLIFGLKFMV